MLGDCEYLVRVYLWCKSFCEEIQSQNFLVVLHTSLQSIERHRDQFEVAHFVEHDAAHENGVQRHDGSDIVLWGLNAVTNVQECSSCVSNTIMRRRIWNGVR
ncbi:hypothetical protein AcV7_008581 [Taiwanofungus camphoratus]|nr:hypothetical protein AcV7_008581 [Antrodia cinnamomea]